jgi:hypothetical protein
MDSLGHLMDTPQLLALAAALGWVSGIRLYAAVFLTGIAGYLGWIDLPAGLQVLQHPGVLAASGFMCFIEFFADKIPFVDSIWDTVHTFIRIPAGAALAFGALGAEGPGHGLDRGDAGRRPGGDQPRHQDDDAGGGQHLAGAVLQRRRLAAGRRLVVFMLWLSATHPVLFRPSCWW